MLLQARTIMTANVETVEPDASIGTVIQIMLSRRLSGLPVIAATGELMGIVTEGDLLRRVETGTDHVAGSKRLTFLDFLIGGDKGMVRYIHSHSRRVSDIMTEKVVTITEDTTLPEIVALMEKHKVRRLPVERAGRLVGIVSRADLVAVLGRRLAELEPTESVRDEDILDRIRMVLDASPWSVQSSVDAGVRDGVVTLEGVIHDERQRAAFRVAVETVPGVVSVIDHIVFVEPMTGSIYPV